MLAKFLHEKVDQPAPMLVFLGRHVGEHPGAVGKVLSESFGEVEVNAAILFLAADGQREKLPFL